MTHLDQVIALQTGWRLNAFAVDLGAIGGVEVLDPKAVRLVGYLGMSSGHFIIGQDDIIGFTSTDEALDNRDQVLLFFSISPYDSQAADDEWFDSEAIAALGAEIRGVLVLMAAVSTEYHRMFSATLLHSIFRFGDAVLDLLVSRVLLQRLFPGFDGLRIHLFLEVDEPEIVLHVHQIQRLLGAGATLQELRIGQPRATNAAVPVAFMVSRLTTGTLWHFTLPLSICSQRIAAIAAKPIARAERCPTLLAFPIRFERSAALSTESIIRLGLRPTLRTKQVQIAVAILQHPSKFLQQPLLVERFGNYSTDPQID